MSKLIKESKIQRVKLRVLDPTTGEYKNSRRTTRCQITTFSDKDTKEVVKTEYMLFPYTFVTLDQIVLDWVHGPTPTPKASSKYTKEELKKFGYSEEIINSIYQNKVKKDSKRVKKLPDEKELERRKIKKLRKSLVKQALDSQKDHKTTFKTVMRQNNPNLKKSNRNQQRKAESTGNLGNKRRY